MGVPAANARRTARLDRPEKAMDLALRRLLAEFWRVVRAVSVLGVLGVWRVLGV